MQEKCFLNGRATRQHLLSKPSNLSSSISTQGIAFPQEERDGWGPAIDEKVLFGSDGTSTLYLINHQSFKVIGKHIVTYNGHEVHNLNELEYINGEVWANVWQTDCMARISPKDVTLLGWILLQNLQENLVQARNNGIDVLNVIAWDSAKKRILVTGKHWPKLYEIKLHRVKKKKTGKRKRFTVGDQSKFKWLKYEQDFMITLSSTGSNVQLFHYDCKAILLSIQSLPRIVLRRCCGGGAVMMPKMILIWGFRVEGILEKG